MRKKLFRALLSVALCCVLVAFTALSVSALDNKYVCDELGISIKIPKEYTVISRESEREDLAFTQLKLDYDETMTAFAAANIYLQATSDDGILKITLTKTADENSEALNNYSLLSSAERNQVLDAFLESDAYTSGVEIKHNGNIYFDFALTQHTQTGDIFAYQCHTVVNGMNINLTLQKSDEDLTADEIKEVTNIANTISFDKIKYNTGPSLDWWRVLLWVVILVVIALLANYFYRQSNIARVQKLKDRKNRTTTATDVVDFDDAQPAQHTVVRESKRTLLSALGFENDIDDDEVMSFDESLGYDTVDYRERANTDMDSFDISVKGKDPHHGVSYFEDDGENIDDKPDYFESYFTEEVESRPVHKRMLSAVALHLRLAIRHMGYFFKNLYRLVVSKISRKK